MKKVRLYVQETLKYTREVYVLIPDEMDEAELNSELDEAQRHVECISDFVYELDKLGIHLESNYDTEFDSPDYSEVECDDYEFVEEEELK